MSDIANNTSTSQATNTNQTAPTTDSKTAEAVIQPSADNGDSKSPGLTAKEAGSRVEAKQGNEVAQAAAEAVKRKFKVKIDDQEKEIDEDELVRDYQLKQASYKKMSEAAKLRKEAEDFFELLKTNPKKALTHPKINADLRTLAEDFLKEQLEEELLDPKDKEIKKLKREMDEIRAEKEALKKKEEDERAAAMQQKYQEQFTQVLEEALKLSGLPRNKRSINRVIDYIEQALDNDIEVTPKDIAKMAREDYESDVKALFGSTDPESLLSMFGEETITKLRKADLKKLKKPGDEAPTPAEQPKVETVSQDDKPKKRLTAKDIWGK